VLDADREDHRLLRAAVPGKIADESCSTGQSDNRIGGGAAVQGRVAWDFLDWGRLG
jgi:hypothetical protein